MKGDWFRARNFTAALAAGLPAPLVFFVAGSAFEKSPLGEVAGALLIGSAYLAFAQIWVVPRRLVSPATVWPTLLGSLVPLAFSVVLIAVLENPRVLWQIGLPCLGAGLVGGWLGAGLARRLTAPTATRRSTGRRSLHLAGLSLLLATVLILMLGVIPLVLAGSAPGFNTPANVVLFRVTALLGLLAAAGLAWTAWRSASPAPKSLLGPVAFGTLLLGLIHAGMGAVCGHYPALLPAAHLLWVCAAANFAVTFLVTIDSVLDDRHEPAFGPGP